MKQTEPQSNNFEGYVLYGLANNSSAPIGVISENFRRKAIANYIPKGLKEAVIEIEDRRFYQHIGFDFKAIIRAIIANINARKFIQGGSTITQQLARNLAYSSNRTLFTKFLEAIKAVQLESNYSKHELLELYFNNIYFGNNLYGIRSASLCYFNKEPFKLTNSEQIVLLTLLRGPNYYLANTEKAESRFKHLNKLLVDKHIISVNRFRKNSKYRIKLRKDSLGVYDRSCVPFISRNINEATKTILTTIDYNLQKEINCWVASSKYPVTVLCIIKGSVVASSSSYGSKHPFCFKTNVGSTLKPFLYSFLRQNGFSNTSKISAINNNALGWKVREVIPASDFMTLAQGLFLSNNNVFINACMQVGLDRVFNYLSTCLSLDRDQFLPSSILGATKSGITLHQLATSYYNFYKSKHDPYVLESYSILCKIAKERLGVENIYLKTGTTNKNSERFAILGDSDRVFAILRGENSKDDFTKEGSFLTSIKKFARKFVTPDRTYKWT